MYSTNPQKQLTCKLPRKKKAIEALFCLIWKKPKKDRAKWIINDLNGFV